MQKTMIFVAAMLVAGAAQAQRQFSRKELSINAFRNPSVGAEFRLNRMSVHAGYYPTAFKAGENTDFFKAGVTYWFAPVGKKENPSSFYAGASYLHGYSRDYAGDNALGMEAGFRWMIVKGLNFRIGAIAVAGGGEDVKINPAPGLSYSFFFK